MIYEIYVRYNIRNVIFEIWYMRYGIWGMIYDIWDMILGYDIWHEILYKKYETWDIYEIWDKKYDIWDKIYDIRYD
jgi:hypothetical protein